MLYQPRGLLHAIRINPFIVTLCYLAYSERLIKNPHTQKTIFPPDIYPTKRRQWPYQVTITLILG